MPRARGKYGLGMGALKGNRKEVVFFEGSGRVELDPWTDIATDTWTGVRTWTSKYTLNGNTYGNKFAQRVEVHIGYDASGNRVITGYTPISKGMTDAKGRQVTTVEYNRVAYHTDGSNRLDNGFDSLMTELRMSGVPVSHIEGLTTLWDSLSDEQKAQVFNAYRNDANIVMYGSSAIRDTSFTDILKPMDYYNIVRKLVEKQVVG